MGYTYDLDTAVGKVRLLVQDNDLSQITGVLEMRSVAFTDEEIGTFLTLYESDLYRAAAAVLRAWAANKQLIVVARRFSKGTVEYGTIRDDLLKLAKVYDEQSTLSTPADATAEQAWTDFNAERIIYGTWQRESGL